MIKFIGEDPGHAVRLAHCFGIRSPGFAVVLATKRPNHEWEVTFKSTRKERKRK